MFKRVFLIGSISIVAVTLLVLIIRQTRTDSVPSQMASQVRPFTADADLFIHAAAGRTGDGRVVINGDTNLPNGSKLWVEVENGRLPKGGPRVVASDDNVYVANGHFKTQPLWMPVPNMTFTKKDWPAGVVVDVRERPFPAAPFSVHFTSIFNSAWQSTVQKLSTTFPKFSFRRSRRQ